VLNDLLINGIISSEEGPRLKTIISNEGFQKLLKLGESKTK